MLDEYLKRSDVDCFIQEIRHNDRYFHKKIDSLLHHSFYVSNEIALFIFYDALVKYKIILDDIYLFDEFLEQLEKLYKKLDSFEDVRVGINKLICRMVAVKLDVHDVEVEASRRKIITFIYNEYISQGYFIHGFNTSYYDSIKEEGMIPEFYQNYYERFLEARVIFEKYTKKSIIQKDFTNNQIFFTDDVLRGCYYSMYAPMFFYEFLTNEDIYGKHIRKDYYMMDDYDGLVGCLKKYMSNNLFNEDDRKFILDLVRDEWDLLHRKDKKISLLFVKRKKIFNDEHITLKDFLDDDSDLYDVVDRLLSSKRNNVYCSEPISSEDIQFIHFESYYQKKEKEKVVIETDEEEYNRYKEEEINLEFTNVYGKVSFLLLLGSLFVSLGVIISIFLALRG